MKMLTTDPPRARVVCAATVGTEPSAFGFTAVRCSQAVGIRAFITSNGRGVGFCAREGHEASVRRQYAEVVPAARVTADPDCSLCAVGEGPRHEASSRCQSGRRAHCSCETCF